MRYYPSVVSISDLPKRDEAVRGRGNYSSFISIHIHIKTLHYCTFATNTDIFFFCKFLATSIVLFQGLIFLCELKQISSFKLLVLQTRALLKFEPLLKLNEGEATEQHIEQNVQQTFFNFFLFVPDTVFSRFPQIFPDRNKHGTHIFQTTLGRRVGQFLSRLKGLHYIAISGRHNFIRIKYCSIAIAIAMFCFYRIKSLSEEG